MCSKVGVELNFTIKTTNETRDTCDTWGVVPGGAGGAMAHPDFDRSVDPISIRGINYAYLITTGTPGFSDLPTALK